MDDASMPPLRFPEPVTLPDDQPPHKTLVQDNRKFQCRRCCQMFKDRGDLQRHWQSCEARRELSTEPVYVEAVQTADDEVQEVNATILPGLHQQADVHCNHCLSVFAHESNLDAHLRTAHADLKFLCQNCPAAFPSLVDLQVHWWHDHDSTTQRDLQLGSSPPKPLDSRGTEDTSSAEPDPQSSTRREVATTKQCVPDVICLDDDDDDEQELCIELVDYPPHPGPLGTEDSTDQAANDDVIPCKVEYICNVCSEHFHFKDSLNQHKFADHCHLRFYCTKCGASFIRKQIVNLHMKLCNGPLGEMNPVKRKLLSLTLTSSLKTSPMDFLNQWDGRILNVLREAVFNGGAIEWYLVVEVTLYKLDGDVLCTMQPQFYSDHQVALNVACLVDSVQVSIKAVLQTYEAQNLASEGWHVEKINVVAPLIVRILNKES